MRSRPASAVSTTTSRTSASSRSSSAVRTMFASARSSTACIAGSSPWRTRERANAGEAFEASSRQASPRARQNAAEVVTAGLAALDQSLTRHKAELSEVDAAEAFTEAVARQTAYQAAMLASSRVMGLSLADYLR